MRGRNKQAYLRSCNNNRQVKNMFSKQRMGRATAVSEPAPKSCATNESDNNYDTCYLGTKFIPIACTNSTSDAYPYSDAYEPPETFPILSRDTAYYHTKGNTYIYLHSINHCIIANRWSIVLSKLTRFYSMVLTSLTIRFVMMRCTYKWLTS